MASTQDTAIINYTLGALRGIPPKTLNFLRTTCGNWQPSTSNQLLYGKIIPLNLPIRAQDVTPSSLRLRIPHIRRAYLANINTTNRRELCDDTKSFESCAWHMRCTTKATVVPITTARRPPKGNQETAATKNQIRDGGTQPNTRFKANQLNWPGLHPLRHTKG